MLDFNKITDTLVKQVVGTRLIVAICRVLLAGGLYLVLGQNFLWVILGFISLNFIIQSYRLKSKKQTFKNENDRNSFYVFHFFYVGGIIALSIVSFFMFKENYEHSAIALFQYLNIFNLVYCFFLLIASIKLKQNLSFRGMNPSFIAFIAAFQSLSVVIIGQEWVVFYFIFGMSMIDATVLIYMKSRKNQSFFDNYFHARSLFFIREHLTKRGLINDGD